MSLPRYPQYKDSGVAWLGEVPAHWEVVQLKRLARIQNGADYKHIQIGLDVDGYPVIGSGGEFAKASAYIYSGESVLLGRKGTIDRPLYINGQFWAVDTMFYTIVKPQIVAKYLYYCTLTIRFDLYSTSTALPSMTQSDLSGILFAVPRYTEQSAIATFLDRETAKIDALVAEQEKLLTLLAEKRQATISHAVTKGLNRDAPMKDSGVEWLGEVPAHWQISKLKRLCLLITDGAHISPETDGGTFHFVSTKDVIDDSICFEGSLLTSEASYEYLVRSGCKPLVGDVLFSKDGTIGRTVVVSEVKDFVVASSLIIIRPNQEFLASDYLNYLCKSSFVSRQVESFVKGAGLPRLSIHNLLKVIGIFAPVKEQSQIIEFLNQETARLDALTTEATRAIALLKERRSALISAAVTGKIDVRELI